MQLVSLQRRKWLPLVLLCMIAPSNAQDQAADGQQLMLERDEAVERQLDAAAEKAFNDNKRNARPLRFDESNPFKYENEGRIDPSKINLTDIVLDAEPRNSDALNLKNYRKCQNREVSDATKNERLANVEMACSSELEALRQGLPPEILATSEQFIANSHQQRSAQLQEATDIRVRNSEREANKIELPKSYQRELNRLVLLELCLELRAKEISGSDMGCPEELTSLELTDEQLAGIRDYVAFYGNRAQERAN